MTDNEKIPIRPAAVHFEAPTHEPLVCAVLITWSDELQEYHAYVRTGADYHSPDRNLIALLLQSIEIRNLAETERDHPES